MSHIHAFPCIRTLYSIYFEIFKLLGNFLIVFFLSLSLSLSVYVSLLLWHPNVNMLRPRTLFVPRHLLMLTLPLFLSGSMIRRPNWTSLRTSLDEAFIRNAKSFYWTSPTVTYPLSFIVGVRSHCVTFWSPIHLCWSRSFTPTCMDLIIQYLFLLLAFEV